MQATGSAFGSVGATLDEVSRLHAVRTRADADLFALAAVFADQHPGETLPGSRTARPGGTVLPGLERSVRVGGLGTPSVAEFAWAELGARLQVSPWSARQLVADALDVRHRLPLIWARVTAGQARVGHARRVAARTRHLSVEAAARVDRAMVDFVDGALPWGRFESRLAGRIVRADPAVAAEREAAARVEQLARRTRSSEHGVAGFYVRSTVGVIARLDATVAFLADALKAFGDPDPEDLRRVKAVAVLANPVRAVELLAAFAALRKDTEGGSVAPLVEPVETHPAAALVEPVETHPGTGLDKLDQPGGGSGLDRLDQPNADQPGALDQPGDALARMDAFARRVGFTPTRLPDWLAPPEPDQSPSDEARPGFRFDWSKLLPPLTLYLHLSADDLATGTGGVARWEGEGPVTHAFVHQHLRPLHGYVIKPVIDLAHQAPADAYELPDRLREAVHLLAPSDVFPFAAAPSRHLDVDHTIAYQPSHPSRAASPEKHWSTRIGNLGPLGRTHHRIKTHGHWTLRQPFTGIYLWRDPHGVLYLQDHTGTHPVGAARTHDPDLDLYPADNLIQVDFPQRA